MITDDTDQKMLLLLRENARRANRDIAQRLNLAESTVAVRIRRLEESGVLLGYHARIRAGDHMLVVWAAIELIDAAKRSEAAAFLRSRTEVTNAEETFGDFDLIFRAELKDRRHWAQFEADLIASVAPFGRLRGGFAAAEAEGGG